MKKNMGNTDRSIRIIIALALAFLYYFEVITGTLGIVAVVIAGIFVLTSFVKFCPIYAIFGMRTCPASEN